MGRSFGDYNEVTIEVWNGKKKKREFRKIKLAKLIDEYSIEAAALMEDIINLLPSKWHYRRCE